MVVYNQFNGGDLIFCVYNQDDSSMITPRWSSTVKAGENAVYAPGGSAQYRVLVYQASEGRQDYAYMAKEIPASGDLAYVVCKAPDAGAYLSEDQWFNAAWVAGTGPQLVFFESGPQKDKYQMEKSGLGWVQHPGGNPVT